MPDYNGISIRMNILDQEIRMYFIHAMLEPDTVRLFDYQLLTPLEDNESNSILKSGIEFVVEKHRQYLKITEDSRYVLEAITEPRYPHRHGVWMSCKGIKPDLSMI